MNGANAPLKEDSSHLIMNQESSFGFIFSCILVCIFFEQKEINFPKQMDSLINRFFWVSFIWVNAWKKQ